jgi:hypothetical protein
VSRVPEENLPAVPAVAAISTAPATAAVSAASAATAMAATSAAITASPAAATAAALSLRPCFIHHEVSPAEILTVQRIDRAIRIFVAVHFDKRKPARLPGKTIADQIHTRGSYTYLREPLVELIFRR